MIRTSGDIGAVSPWIPGLEIVDVHHSEQSAEQFERIEYLVSCVWRESSLAKLASSPFT